MIDTKNWIEYSSKLCDLQHEKRDDDKNWPMYSFDRVASIFWNAFANALRDRGLSETEIKDQLQSKGMRWMLDGLARERIKMLGYQLGQDYKPIKLD